MFSRENLFKIERGPNQITEISTGLYLGSSKMFDLYKKIELKLLGITHIVLAEE